MEVKYKKNQNKPIRPPREIMGYIIEREYGKKKFSQCLLSLIENKKWILAKGTFLLDVYLFICYNGKEDTHKITKEVKMAKYNVAVYSRISREDGDKAESESLVNQRELIKNFVKRQKEGRKEKSDCLAIKHPFVYNSLSLFYLK